MTLGGPATSAQRCGGVKTNFEGEAHHEGESGFQHEARKRGHNTEQEVWIHGVPGLLAIAQLVLLTILSNVRFEFIQLFLFDCAGLQQIDEQPGSRSVEIPRHQGLH